MDTAVIYSVPLDQLSIDGYARVNVERPAFVEIVNQVWKFQAVVKMTQNGVCQGTNATCMNQNCGNSTNEMCSNERCVVF